MRSAQPLSQHVDVGTFARRVDARWTEIVRQRGKSVIPADGTSYSAPYVSATAALLRSKYPSETAGQIIARLIGTADRAGGGTGRDDRLGYGIVDPLHALNAPVPVATDNPLTAPKPAPGHASATDKGSSGIPVSGLVGGTGIAVAAGGTSFVILRRRRRGPA